MRKFTTSSIILAFAIIGLITIAITEGCRKVDREGNAGSSAIAESRFFNQHKSSEPLVQAIAGFMKRKNAKSNFVATTVSRIGYPRWDKARTVNGQRRTGFTGSDDDTTDITYIPFVRDSQNYVNAAWIIKTTPTDTAFGYLCDWQYKDYGFDSTQSSWNARNVFHLFTRMDKDVFDRNQFRIIDEELLIQPEKDYLDSVNLDFDSSVVVYSMEPTQQGSFNNLLMPVTICDDIFTCIRVRTPDDDPLPARQSLNQVVPGCPSGMIPISSTICTEVWVYIPSSGGGSDDGPGGDPGSGGGGGTPPDCPSGSGRNNLTDDPCGPGWIPIEDLPSIEEPIDSMLNDYAIKINNIADSIFALSQTNNEEWGFIIVKNAAGEVYAKNCTTSHNDGHVKLNKSLAPGETIIAELHTHPAPNSSDRSAPSGGDFNTLRINSRNRYTSFIDCGNIRYAIVIEDVNKSRNFFQQSQNAIDLLSLNQDAVAQTKPNWATNWQNATQQAIIDLIGSSMVSGIGIYISDSTKTNFTKLN